MIIEHAALNHTKFNTKISWSAAATGALIGTFSHVFLDSMMHSDMNPLAPFNATNGLLHLMPVGRLYLLCAALGAAGILFLIAKRISQSAK